VFDWLCPQAVPEDIAEDDVRLMKWNSYDARHVPIDYSGDTLISAHSPRQPKSLKPFLAAAAKSRLRVWWQASVKSGTTPTLC
jgi:hypothetical protein